MYVTVAPTLVAGVGLALTGGPMLWLVPVATLCLLAGLILTRYSHVSSVRRDCDIEAL
jgi:hypothetical protein